MTKKLPKGKRKIEYCRKHHKARTLIIHRGRMVERCNTCGVYWQ